VLRYRLVGLLCSVFAVLAMATSAIAACACTHHQTKKIEAKGLSCHGVSHDSAVPRATNDAPSGPQFGETCSCYLNRVQPAITAKSEQKKLKSHQSDISGSFASIEFQQQLIPVVEASPVRSSFNLYTKLLLRSGPSRAPPRQ
jgi:hypothetical protein